MKKPVRIGETFGVPSPVVLEANGDVLVHCKEMAAAEAIVAALNATQPPEAADTQRLDLIQNTGEYPWKDYDCWKFRVGKERFTGATVRECLDAALASSKPQPQVGKDKP